MAKRTPIERFTFDNFHGGWRPDKPHSKLQPGELHDVLNIEYTYGGAIRKRGGMEQFTTTVTDQTDGHFFFAPRVLTLADPDEPSSIPVYRQIAIFVNGTDGSIYYQAFGELAAEFTTNNEGADFVDSGHSLGPSDGVNVNFFRTWPTVCLTWDTYVYMTSLKYNGFSGGSGAGGTWQTEAGTTGSASKPLRYDAAANTFSRPSVHQLEGATSGFPRARCGVVHHSRIFCANVHSEGNFRWPSRIYWSNAGTAETWEGNSWIGVGENDGQEIVALVPFGEQMLIFKNNSTWTMVGTDEDTFALYPLSNTIGTEGTYAACADVNNVYFFDTMTCTIWKWDGTQFEDIGSPVSPYLRDNINFNATFRFMLNVFDRYLWFSYSKDDGTPSRTDENTETLIYDLEYNIWTRWDFGVPPNVQNRFSDYQAEHGTGLVTPGDANPYFINNASSRDDFVTRGWMGFEFDADGVLWSDYGSNISTTFRTGWFSPDRGAVRKRLRRFEVLVNELSDSITINLYRDFLTAEWQDFSFDALADTAPTIYEYNLHQSSVDTNAMFNWLSMYVETAHTDLWQINEFNINWSARGTLRGDVGGTQYHE